MWLLITVLGLILFILILIVVLFVMCKRRMKKEHAQVSNNMTKDMELKSHTESNTDLVLTPKVNETETAGEIESNKEKYRVKAMSDVSYYLDHNGDNNNNDNLENEGLDEVHNDQVNETNDGTTTKDGPDTMTSNP